MDFGFFQNNRICLRATSEHESNNTRIFVMRLACIKRTPKMAIEGGGALDGFSLSYQRSKTRLQLILDYKKTPENMSMMCW